jgi:hypothetical protein
MADDDDARHATHERVAACLGDDAYNRLVDAVENTAKKGRLRFWQERLFERLLAETGIEVTSLDAYVRLFDGAPFQALYVQPLTREAFLANANNCFYSGRRPEIAAEWLREAWAAIPAFRDNVTYELTRGVRKLGTMAGEVTTATSLNAALTREQVVAMYEAIRDESMRHEDEWRGDFERLFPAHAAALPAPRATEDGEPPDA